MEPKDYKKRTYLSAIYGIGYETDPEIAYDAIKSLRNYQAKLW